jgi:addiction module HigA family antidote
MTTTPTDRPPKSPGEVLFEEFLKPQELSQVACAKRLGIPLQRLNAVVTGRRAVSAETAILLAEEFKTTAEFWMALQAGVDLWHAAERLKKARARSR